MKLSKDQIKFEVKPSFHITKLVLQKKIEVTKSPISKPIQTDIKKATFQFSVYQGNNAGIIREILLKRGNWNEISTEQGIYKADFIWKPTGFMHKHYDRIDKNQTNGHSKVVNHIENLRGITTKTGLIRSLYKYLTDIVDKKYCVFDSTPTSYLITSSLDTSEYYQFVSRYNQIQNGEAKKERLPMKHCQQNIWLIKPAAMNQGRGIEIFRCLKDINKFISSRPAYTYWVIQKYIEKPLLYKQDRKFDIRVWAMLTHTNDLYIYTEGYIRTTSDEYKIDAKDNYIHLTNNCLQKFGDNYGKHEDGNTVSFKDFQQYMVNKFPDMNIDIQRDFMPRFKDLIIDTYQSIKSNINQSKRKNSFELFGYDFMIDEDLRTWLIEVNSNPYIGIPNEYIKTLLPNMIDDLFSIVLDPICPPQIKQQREDNGFELIYSEQYNINQRRSYEVDVYPFIEMKQIRPIDLKRKKSHKIKTEKKIIKKQPDCSPYNYPGIDSKLRLSQSSKPVRKKNDSRHIKRITKSGYQSEADYKNYDVKYEYLKQMPIDQNDQNNNIIQFNIIFKDICSKFIQWEIFDDEQINDAVNGLYNLIKDLKYFQEDDIDQLISIITNDIPINIKESLVTMLFEISKTLKKIFLYNTKFITFLTKLCLETCKEEYYRESCDNIYKIAINILINMTFGNNQQVMLQSIDYGLLCVIIKLQIDGKYINNHNKLKRIIMDRIKIEQINYQLTQFNKDNYEQLIQEELDFKQIKQVFIELYKSKQKKRNKKPDYKIEERRKQHIDEMKQEMVARELILTEDEERKNKMIEVLRKREDLKQQEQVDKYKIHISEKQKVAEDIEKNKQRLLDDRAKALDYWRQEDHSQTQNTWNVVNKINPKLFQTEKTIQKSIFDNKQTFPETNPFKANRYSQGVLDILKQNIRNKEQIGDSNNNLNIEGVRNLLIGSKQTSLNSSYSAQAIKQIVNVSQNQLGQSVIFSLQFLKQEIVQESRSKKEETTKNK